MRIHEEHQAAQTTIVRLKQRRSQAGQLLRARRKAEAARKSREAEQRVQLEAYQNRWHAAEGRIVTLEQSLEDRQETLDHWRHWLVALSGNIEAVFNSLTWRAGNLLTRLALALMLRKPDPGAHGQILQIVQEIAAWRQAHPDLDHPSALASAIGASVRPERYAHLPVLTLPSTSAYKKWYAHHRCKAEDLERQRQEIQEWPDLPFVSLAIPCYNSPARWLDALLAHWSQVKDFLPMSRPMSTCRLLLTSGLTGTL